jgi:hypothetical protein
VWVSPGALIEKSTAATKLKKQLEETHGYIARESLPVEKSLCDRCVVVLKLQVAGQAAGE